MLKTAEIKTKAQITTLNLNLKYGILITICGFILLSYSANPPQGNSGAPFDRTCARSGCHSTNSSLNGEINILGIPDEVMPNTTYDFSVMMTSTNASLAGFQMVAVRNDETNSGSITEPGTSSTISSFLSRTYFEHQPAQDFNNGQAEFTAKWTSPSEADTETNFYISAIFANDNNSASGDSYERLSKTVTTLQNNSELQVEIEFQSPLCFEGNDGSATAIASGGSGNYDYVWSTGQTNSTINDLSAGLYIVTVTDMNTSIVDTVVIEDAAPIFSDIIIQDSLICAGDNMGSIAINVEGGAPPYSYVWSNGSTQEALSPLGGGLYRVTITDANNCLGTNEISFFPSDRQAPVMETIDTLVLDLTSENSSIELNDINQLVISSSDNCTEFLDFSWSPQQFTCDDVGGNIVNVVARDESSNRTTHQVTVIIRDREPPLLTCPADTLFINSCGIFSYPMPESQDNCEDILIELIEGLGNNQQYPIGVTTNLYRATDLSGNISECEIVVVNEVDIEVDFITSDVTCHGKNDGWVELDISGVNPPFEFDIEGGISPINLAAGNYNVTISDITGCEISSNFSIDQPSPIQIEEYEIRKPTTSNSGDGSITVLIEGGIPPYTYQWFTEEELFATSKDLTLLFPGMYTLMVTDSLNCKFTSEIFEVEEITSTNDLVLNSQIEASPNPTRDFINISLNDVNPQHLKLSIIDASGIIQAPITLSNENNYLRIDHLRPGLYFFVFRIENKMATKKILKLP